MTDAIFSADAMAAAIAAAASQEPDMKNAQKGGGNWVPPAAGGCIVTLVGYIETGIQMVPPSKVDPVKFPGGPEDQVDLIFEISGKGHEPKELENGTKIPERLTVTLKKSLNEKAWYYKIFNTLNYDKQATHFAQLLGKHFIATIIHSPNKKNPAQPYAGFKCKTNGYTFKPPVYNPNPLDMTETALVPKPAVLTPLKLFLWTHPSKPMWDSLFIEGKYDDRTDEKTGVVTPGRSKNVLQEKIRKAQNFEGSPIFDIVGGIALEDMEIPVVDNTPEAAPTPAAQPDEAAAAAALAAL